MRRRAASLRATGEAAVEITEVRIKLAHSSDERLKAFASVTFDRSFVVRDIKVVQGPSGLFIAMPSRKIVSPCPRCAERNHLRAKHCNECGARLPAPRGESARHERMRLHMDVAHPIHARCRERIQKAVLEAYERETARCRGKRARTPRPAAQEPSVAAALAAEADAEPDLADMEAPPPEEEDGDVSAAGPSPWDVRQPE